MDFWRTIWKWITSIDDNGAWLQAGAQLLAGILGVVGAFWVLTIQLRKDRARRLVEGEVELIQFRILLVRDLIREYRMRQAIRPRPSPEDRRHIYEALAAVSRLYAYFEQKVGARKLTLEESKFHSRAMPEVKQEDGTIIEWPDDNAPALRRRLHGAFNQFYESADGHSREEDDGIAWKRNAQNLSIVDSNLNALYVFFDFAAKVIQKGHVPFVGGIPIVGSSWWRNRKLLKRYRQTIVAIREYGEEAKARSRGEA